MPPAVDLSGFSIPPLLICPCGFQGFFGLCWDKNLLYS